MAYTTSNSANVRWQEVYQTALQSAFSEQLLTMGLFADKTAMFPHGDQLKISQIGSAVLKDRVENNPALYRAIDLGRVSLGVDHNKEDAFYITDEQKEDSPDGGADLFAKRVKASMDAFMEDRIEAVLKAANDSQTAGDPNTIVKPHRVALPSGYTAQDFIDAVADIKTAWDKAKVPFEGRVLFVDPDVENVLNKSTILTADNPAFQGVINSGFSRNARFVHNIHGFDVWTTNLLTRIASETVSGVSVTNGVANIAMCLRDEDAMPIMGVLRKQPTPEFKRNGDLGRDEWVARARYGFAVQRPESLYVLITQ
jgi:hypothetical protein